MDIHFRAMPRTFARALPTGYAQPVPRLAIRAAYTSIPRGWCVTTHCLRWITCLFWILAATLRVRLPALPRGVPYLPSPTYHHYSLRHMLPQPSTYCLYRHSLYPCPRAVTPLLPIYARAATHSGLLPSYLIFLGRYGTIRMVSCCIGCRGVLLWRSILCSSGVRKRPCSEVRSLGAATFTAHRGTFLALHLPASAPLFQFRAVDADWFTNDNWSCHF